MDHGTRRRDGGEPENRGRGAHGPSGFRGTSAMSTGRTSPLRTGCRILSTMESKEQDGVYYDWYTIDSHYRMQQRAEGRWSSRWRVGGGRDGSELRAATRLYVQKATDIIDEQAR